VVLAYPVRTQSVTETSVLLSAVPYDPSVMSSITTVGGAAAFDVTTVGRDAAEFPNVDGFLQTGVVSLNAINPATGALQPDRAQWTAAVLPTLVAVPKAGAVPSCGGGGPPFCAPLAVFLHGIGDSRYMMLGVADALAEHGFVVVAIDMPLHGDRAFCKQSSECETAAGGAGTCTPDQAMAGQGDTVPPGHCGQGEHLKLDTTNLQTFASGNYFLSANFFRTRDTLRQDLLDQAALVLAVAPPQTPAPGSNPLFDALALRGIVVDPRHVVSVGHSLGGMASTPMLAANPRFERGAFSPTGGTLVDVFTTSPSFHDEVCTLFDSLGVPCAEIGVDPAVTAKYLQLLVVAKWVMDPAEPLNFARHVGTKLPSPLLAPFPDGLGGTGVVHATTAVLGQASNCDATIPNAFNLEEFGVGSIPWTLYVSGASPLPDPQNQICANPGAGPVPHGAFVDSVFSDTPIGGRMREDAATFLLDGTTVPPAQVTLP
jgi:dienelactone hydrolase